MKTDAPMSQSLTNDFKANKEFNSFFLFVDLNSVSSRETS